MTLIFKLIRQSMNTDIDELETVQQYIQTLFDSMPCIDLQQNHDLETNLIQQNIIYGRKIIQLSDKFTAKYRKDHFFDRKDVEEKITQIYRIVCPHTYHSNLDQMVAQILKALGQDRVSYGEVQSRGSNVLVSRAASANPNYNFATKDSKLQFYRDQGQLVQLKYENNSSEPRRDKNLTKSKFSYENEQTGHQKRKKSIGGSNVRARNTTSKKTHHQSQDFTTKNVLQLKNKFQEEVQGIKQIFEKMNKIIKNSGLRISEENSTFTKQLNDEDKNNLKDFTIANVENSIRNIKKLSQFVQLLQEHFDKKLKIQGFAQGKFKVYTQEISKREQVFSFAVSKMLEHLGDIRENVASNTNSAESLNLIDSLESIGNQFYELYPSHSIIKDLKVQKMDKEYQKIGYKNYGCQISIGKSEKTIHRQMTQSKRNLLQLYKVTTRVYQIIERFQKSIKFKKQIDQKDVQKFVQSIRDSFPKKNSSQIPQIVANQVASYQQDLRKLMDQNERTQKQLNDQFNKKNKKNDKKISQLQKTIDQLIIELKKQQQSHETSKKKWVKKLQTQKQQNKLLNASKKQLQKQIKQLSKQINRLQDDIKEQYRKCDEVEQNLLKQNKQIIQELKNKEQKIRDIQLKYQQESNKWEEQRQIYHQKIILLQTHQENNSEQTAQLKVELQEMIKDNQSMKKQILQLTDVYQQNVKQQEQLIRSLNQLEKKGKQKKLEIKQLKQKLKITEEINKNLQQDKQRCFDEIRKWQKSYKEKEEEAENYKKLGVLNDSDIEVLKQEMDKVKQAYLEAEEQLENSKIHIEGLENQKQYLVREMKKLKRDVEQANSRWENNCLNKERMQKDIREFHDQLSLKTKEYGYLVQQTDDLKRQVSKLKKQNQQLRQNYTKCENQLRKTRQDQQKKFENQSLQSGKRKLQLQATKVQLRRKTQQLEKIKQTFDEKIQVLQSKNKQLSQFITQKQMLARINNSHMSG